MEQIRQIESKAKLIGIPCSRLQERVGVKDSTWYRWREGSRRPNPDSQSKINEVEEWLDRMLAATGA